jgi:hypothetical protein
VQEAVAVFVEGFLKAGDFDEVNAGAEVHVS